MTVRPISGTAVRRDWPNCTHEFVRWFITPDEAYDWVLGDIEYWKRSPVRPRFQLVTMSAVDYEHHIPKRECDDANCPTSENVGIRA